MRTMLWCGLLLWLGILPSSVVQAESPFTAHEWGTFTTLQNDAGKEVPGINIDDEPVPAFVHNLAPYLLNSPVLTNQSWQFRQKAAPRQHPMVTMRLETPVIYFHPKPGQTLPKMIDVEVKFRGGWLTEFYPYAEAKVPGMETNSFDFGPLTPETVGELAWRNVRLDTKAVGPETDEQVWLAPRKVNAIDVTVENKRNPNIKVDESERYLFYRGVANLHAPLRVTTDREKKQLEIFANFQGVLGEREQDQVPAAWLVDIRPDGQVAYRSLDKLPVTSDPKLSIAKTSSQFSAGDYATKNMDTLRETMHGALVKDGLNPDEATAMLATWQRAYFQTAGLRLFFVVPRRWTDHYLPLRISTEPQIARVMMGRIELITDAQRSRLATMAKGPVSSPEWIDKIPDAQAKDKLLSGRSNFGDLGVKIPADYQEYLALGRFRNALVIAEQKRTDSANLKKFIGMYSLQPYKWSE